MDLKADPDAAMTVTLKIVGCGTVSKEAKYDKDDLRVKKAEYEYRLRLARKAANVFSDEQNVLIATPIWSATTTARDLISETVEPGEPGFSIINKKTGESVSENCVITYEPQTGSVMIDAVKYDEDDTYVGRLAPGSYRLTATAVYSKADKAEPIQAYVDFTVKNRDFLNHLPY